MIFNDDEAALKSVQFCLQQDALERIKKMLTSFVDTNMYFTSREHTIEKLCGIASKIFMEGKRVGEFPEMERMYRRDAGKASEVFERASREAKREEIPVHDIVCAKCKTATFEIVTATFEEESYSKPFPVFVCNCYCDGCRSYFETRMTMDVIDLIFNGNLKGWKINETAKEITKKEIRRYFERKAEEAQ